MKRFTPIEILLTIALIFMAVVLVCALIYSPERQQHASFATAPPRLPDTFRFDPKHDITTYELALAMSMMMGGLDYLERMRPIYDAMPPEVKRHWLPPEPKK